MQTARGESWDFLRKLLVGALLLSAPAAAPSQPNCPHLVQSGGKHALIVDGAPFLILGAQTNNSSNYPAVLPKVWPVVRELHANTVEIPVAWEQIEPQRGPVRFLLGRHACCRRRGSNSVRLVLLWFGTWKNTSPQLHARMGEVGHAALPAR